MSVTWSIDPAKRLVTIRYGDPYTAAEWSEALRAALGDAWFQPGFGFLIDRRFAQPPTDEFAKAVAGFVSAHLVKFGAARIAIVVSTTAGYGMGRMQESLNEMAGLSSRAFTSADAALDWLRGDE